MFAKIFQQILDSSIAEDPEMRFTFMDFLLLSDRNGVVDMTLEAIARRTNRSLDVIKTTVAALEAPDPASRNAEHGGARIRRIDDHRDWGWLILNYDYFRKIASEEQRRARTRARVKKFRVTHCNAPDTAAPRKTTPKRNAVKRSANAGNAMQREKERHKEVQSAHADFVSKWCSAYLEVFKERYAFQRGKDGNAIKLLLASSGKTPDELIRMAKAAWANSSGFYSKGAVSICGFNSKFNEIRQELNEKLKNGKTHQTTAAKSSRTTGTANTRRIGQYADVGKV